MGNIQELEKQLAEAKAEEREKELQTLTENLISKPRESLQESQFREKQISVPSAVFYEKFWVTGNTITVLKWNISFAEQEEITNSQVISCLLTETKLRYPHRRTAIVLSTI
jgi:hypothetical protein